MKIFERAPQKIVRITIKRGNEFRPKPISLIQTTVDEVEFEAKTAIQQFASVFKTGDKTTVLIREHDGKNGKSISVSFYGISAKDTYNILLTHFKKITDENS